MTQVYLLGTTHFTKKSKEQVKKVFENYKIDLILSEGVWGKLKIKEWIRDPFLSICIRVYFFISKIWSNEFYILEKISKDKKIPFRNIDKNINELFNYFYRRYNPIIFILIFLGLKIFYESYKIKNISPVIISLLMTFMIYFVYFVIKTGSIRNESFSEKINNTIKKKDYRNILIVCGKLHCGPIKKRFKNVIRLDKKYLTCY